MDKLEWKKRSWVGTSLLIVSVGCIIASFLGILFLGDKAAVFNLLLIVAEIVYIVFSVTVAVISFRDEDQYEKIRKVFDDELCKRDKEIRKRDDRLYQRQKGIRSMVSRYKYLKNDYNRLESRCAQLEAENRELFEIRNECAKLRGENMAMRKHLHIGD